MAGNQFGKLFSVTTFGESHGAAIGGVIDGCPAGIELDLVAIQHDLRPSKTRTVGHSNTAQRTRRSQFLFWCI